MLHLVIVHLACTDPRGPVDDGILSVAELPTDLTCDQATVELKCTELRIAPGHTVIEGDDADAQAKAFCEQYNATEGQMYISGVDWEDMSRLSCLCDVGDVLAIVSSPNLKSLRGLESLEHITTTLGLVNLPLVEDLGGLQNACIGQDLYATGLDSISDLRGLRPATDMPGYLYFNSNDFQLSMLGLGGLRSVGGDIFVGEMDSLQDFAGLDGLESIGLRFEVRDSQWVEDFRGLGSLRSIGQSSSEEAIGDDMLRLENLARLSSFSGLDSLVVLPYLSVDNVGLTSLAGFATGVSIGGVNLGRTGVTSLRGLENAGTVEKLALYDNWTLESLDGFPSATTEMQWLILNGLTRLTDISALANVETVAGDVGFVDLPALTSLHGLESLTTVEGTLALQYLDLIENLDELSALRSTKILYLGELPNATDMEGLRSLDEVTAYGHLVSAPLISDESCEEISALNGWRGFDCMPTWEDYYTW